MELPSETFSELSYDPMEMVETILVEEAMHFERTPEGDICFSLNGGWRHYDLWFSYHASGECLQLCAGLGFKDLWELKGERLSALYELLALVNQRVWFGHFELFSDVPNFEGRAQDDQYGFDIVFRYALAVTSLDRPSMIQTAHMINRVVESVDSFYPAFDMWAKSLKANLPLGDESGSPESIMAACLFETVGEA